MLKGKIELQEPYRSVYKSGSIVINPENRRNVILSTYEGKNTTTSYARYLMAVKLGAFISPLYDVDHINDDKTDDRIENLQLLTKKENKLKEAERYRREIQVFVTIECPACKENYTITRRYYKMKLAAKCKKMFCSRSCAAAFYSYKLTAKIPKIKDDIIKTVKILRQQGKSSYEIARLTKLSRNTVMKYW